MAVAQAQTSLSSDPALAGQPALAGLFPLPLTPMEAFLLADGRPGYPMLADIQLHFAGTLDRNVLESALSAAILRNPLLCCIVGRDERLGQVWLPTDQTPPIDWAPQGEPLDDSYDAPLDLTSQTGLRIYVRQGADRATVLLHFHHSCADALGTFAFVEDLLAAYATLCPGGQPVMARPLDVSRLRRRGLASIVPRKWYQQIFDVLVGAREGLRFFLQAPIPLAGAGEPAKEKPTADASTRPSARAEMVTRTLGPELTARLRATATAMRVTVNDLLLCDLFVAMRRWNAEHGQSNPRSRLRILMPQNLREPEDVATPMANIMSFAFLTRRSDRCQDSRALVESVRAETDAIRRGRLSVYFLGSLATALAAGFLDKLLASKLCFSTAVLSNFGVPERRFVARFPKAAQGLVVGNTVFCGLTGVPPVRPGTRAAFAVVTSACDMTIALKCDPQYFSPIDAARLLDEYVNQLAATATRDPAGRA